MKGLFRLAIALGAAVALSACSGMMSAPPPPPPAAAVPPPAPADPNSLYARLGGREAIAAVVDDAVNRMASDKRINRRFANVNAADLKAKFTDQLCEASGGPCRYTGRDMRTTHTGMRISNREWNITGAHIQAAMRAKGVKPPEQREVMGMLGSMKKDIVGI